MADTTEFARFEQYSRFAGALMAQASNEELAQCARVLALCLAQYRETFGELPGADLLPKLQAEQVSPETARTLADGMENLVGVLASVTRERSVRLAQ
jgi:hypothetical protein